MVEEKEGQYGFDKTMRVQSGAPVIAMKPRLVDDTEPAADECGDDDLFFLLVRRKFARIDEAAKDCAKAKIFEVLSSTNHDKRT
ncbi:hypothetical protein AAVH_13339 [Aphelenchoides avenae]|nr:hypothetical protein AAVH_13339 [Aphelenchus avenae]